MKRTLVILLAIGQLFVLSCRKTTEISSTYSYGTMKTVCLNVNHDGTIVLRAWGNGNNKSEAIEQAKKNALHEVLFDGIRDGVQMIDPLLLEVNAKEKFGFYFSTFFQDDGAYLMYVTENKSKKDSAIKAENNYQEKYGIIVEVNRELLKNRLINDNILKP
jgi:hypothetical protein